ncbi:MAG: glycoside hydrolase family 88/105 protein [Chitinophagaceae bacterium]
MNQVCRFLLACVVFTVALTSSKAQVINKQATKEAMLKALIWQEANPIFAKSFSDWTNGVYYTGVSKAHAATKDKAYTDALKTIAVKNEWKPWERYYHADDIIICFSYLYQKSIRVKDVQLEPTLQIVKDHLYKPNLWKTGVSEGNDPTEKSILWWWCDALFMAPPVIAAYAKETKDTSVLRSMDQYYKETYDLLYNKEEHLFARDTRFLWKGTPNDRKEANGKKIFWGRGNGWVFAGLALLLTELPKNYANRPFYEKLYKEMAEKIISLQQEDGLWRTSLLNPQAYAHGEVSASGLYTYGLAWGVNNGLLKKATYKPLVVKAWNAIVACQQENGKVGWVQNIGADPGPATADTWQNYGTGAFLLAGSQVLKF